MLVDVADGGGRDEEKKIVIGFGTFFVVESDFIVLYLGIYDEL